MPRPPDAHTLKLVHDALTSLTVTRAHVNLGQRRLRQRNHGDVEILEGLVAAEKSIMRAVNQLREIEDDLKCEEQGFRNVH